MRFSVQWHRICMLVQEAGSMVTLDIVQLSLYTRHILTLVSMVNSTVQETVFHQQEVITISPPVIRVPVLMDKLYHVKQVQAVTIL